MSLLVVVGRTGTSRVLLGSALVVIVVLGSVLGVQRSVIGPSPGYAESAAAQPYSQLPMVTATRLSVLVVGDDFAAGYGGIGLNAYPYILCNSVGLNCFVDAQPGTGLINRGRAYAGGTQRLIDRLPIDASLYNADVLIVDAGRNDVESPPSDYAVALASYLETVKRFWPQIEIFVIVPTPPTVTPDAQYQPRAVAITEVVESAGGVVIDPIALGWYSDVDLSSLQVNGVGHLNQRGHELIARRLAEALEKYGIGQSGVVN